MYIKVPNMFSIIRMKKHILIIIYIYQLSSVADPGLFGHPKQEKKKPDPDYLNNALIKISYFLLREDFFVKKVYYGNIMFLKI